MATTTSAETAEATEANQVKAIDAPKKKPVRLIAGMVLGAACLGLVGYYVLHAGLEGTDDAQVEADVVSVPARTGGAVIKVHFTENQKVKEGDLLVEIDPAPATAKFQQAEAELTTAKAAADAADADVQIVQASSRGQKSVAEASLQGAALGATTSGEEVMQAQAQVSSATTARQQASTDLERVKKLVATNSLPKQQLDSAQTMFDVADANLAQAKAHQAAMRSTTQQAQARIQEARARLGQMSAVDAQIAQAQAKAAESHARVQTAQAARDLAALDLSYTKIVAPREGLASKKSVIVGQMLAPGQTVAMIVPTNEVWVTANFKETQLDKMRVGQPAKIEVDSFPDLELHGEVESLSGATGSRFSLLPPENATGNFTKVVQRVPVRIHISNPPTDKTLRPGMSADVTVDTRK
jgi:membrane fusion protein (multidrug efflux system)